MIKEKLNIDYFNKKKLINKPVDELRMNKSNATKIFTKNLNSVRPIDKLYLSMYKVQGKFKLLFLINMVLLNKN